MNFKQFVLSDVASVSLSNVDKKTNSAEAAVKLCNYVDVYNNYAITTHNYEMFMDASANYTEIEKFTLKKGDIAITKDSETRDDIGIPCYVANNFDDTVLLGYHCALIRCNSDLIDSKYLVAYLNSNIARKYFAYNATGSGQRASLSKSTIENMPIFAPSLQDQKMIGCLLSDIDKQICLNRQINDNLEAMARQIYEFICTENKYSAINQKSFEKGTVSDIAEQIICGKTPSTKNQAFYGEEIPFITIPDMYNNTYVVSTERSLSILGKQSQDNKTLQQNSVCVSCIGTAGLVCLVSKTSQTNQQINSIIPKKGISPYFIYFTMKSLALNILSAGSSGSVMPNLSKSKFAELEVKIPDISEIEHFHSLVDPMFKKILSVQEENLILQNIKKQLNDLLINGQVSVNYHL